MPAVLFVLIVSLTSTWWSVYEFDTDEGINLAKADLVAAGYHPYAEIWNDQPPLMTYALVLIKEYLGDDIAWARGFVLLCAALILRSLFAIVRDAYGRPAAWLAVVLLASCSVFGRVSTSVMVGLPAIAVALLALEFALRSRAPAGLTAAGAGAVFGLSLQIKFFTFIAGPALLVAIALSPRVMRWRGRVGFPAIATACALALFLSISALAGQPILDQLIKPHVDADVRSAGSIGSSISRVLGDLAANIWIFLLAIPGAVLAVRRRDRTGITLLVWFVTAWIALSLHWPIWYHHALVMLVPLAGLAGIYADHLRKTLLPSLPMLYRRAAVAAAGLVVLISFILARPHELTPDGASIAKTLAQNAGPDGWVVTDHLIDAHYAGLLSPPELVVFSYKRRLAGNLSTEQIIDVLKTREPSQLLFRRFTVPEELGRYVAAHYDRSDEITDLRYFRRRDTTPADPTSVPISKAKK